ncbi:MULTISPECIES: LacI family DNA-binding transcriptional regulator [Paenibacillus]|uniref:LacI family DNA-binding transcriptional regulator n=1 Tax=Paenibacillus TaxID=44249 RepID=UPI0022B929FB|nr:LacI family DNA-binding transcriptional regulator [Paenibacillus caseinilyticus]MCZ8521818.1 LacI family DNA-binding transcriptional regulator [Paenibacillus caseinilyticus]
MKPTIRDVAKLAGVSISTVSRVMNAPESVAEGKREKVLQAIERLQYLPNAFARGLINKKSHTLGVLIPDIRNPYYAGVIRGMEDAAKALGYSIVICNTDRDKTRLISYLENFNEKQVDGILFTSETVYPDYYMEIRRFRLPVVLVSTHSLEYELASVKINDEEAAYDAVSHLIGLGHRNIGMISLPLSDTIAGLPRYQGFMRAMREHGLPHDSGQVVCAEHWYDEAHSAASRLFGQAPGLTAVFAASDEFAMGVLSYLHERGLKVPGQVSVIGFDNIRMAQMTIPKLTTVAQPVYKLGYTGVEKLHELIEHGRVQPLREYLPHELIIRSSTAPVRERGETPPFLPL